MNKSFLSSEAALITRYCLSPCGSAPNCATATPTWNDKAMEMLRSIVDAHCYKDGWGIEVLCHIDRDGCLEIFHVSEDGETVRIQVHVS